MELLFVTDPLESFKTYKDSTFAMMREAQRRGHTVHACEPRHMLWERGGVVQAQVRSITLTGDATDWFSEAEPQVRSVKDFGAVVMRKDPAV
jgi:glutathione synthase